MNREEVLAHFGKHFIGQIVFVIEKPVQSLSVHFNPVIEAFDFEANEHGYKTRFVLPTETTKTASDANEEKVLIAKIVEERGQYRIKYVI